MMVDAPRVSALLERISTEVERLEEIAARDDGQLLTDPDALPAAKYRCIVAIEAAIDVADHVIASEGLRSSGSFADSFRSLEEGGWLDDELAAALVDAAKFRNVLVHQYTEVDDERVVAIIRTRLDDLTGFVRMVSARILS